MRLMTPGRLWSRTVCRIFSFLDGFNELLVIWNHNLVGSRISLYGANFSLTPLNPSEEAGWVMLAPVDV
jgi:hypothetical protein